MTCNPTQSNRPVPPSWRSVLPIHPAAELFPLMSREELRAHGENIVKTGLTSPIALWRSDPKAPLQLLDGRNRLDAIELVTGKTVEIGPLSLMAGEFLATGKVIELDKSVDPYAYVISANLHRRHLTADDKRKIIAKLILAHPNKSDRQIAEMIRVSHHTVASARAEMERRGQIAHVSTRTDTKGRKQPAKRPKKADLKAWYFGDISRDEAERRGIDTTRPYEDFRPDPDDSDDEMARKDARIEELEREVRRLEGENTAQRSEIRELRARLANAPPADDGLDIPEFLDRTRQQNPQPNP